MKTLAVYLTVLPTKVCPVAPPGAEPYADQLTGYVLWGVQKLFWVALAVSIGAIIAGRIFGMPHASKVGIISIVITFLSGIAYLVGPSILTAILGSGCVG